MAARSAAGLRLTPSAGVSTLMANTRSTETLTLGGGDADGTATGDLGLPRRLRRRAWLPAHRAGDRRGGRAGLALDGARPPGEPRARRAAQAGPDEAAGRRARRPRAPRGARDTREAAPARSDRGRR